MNNTTQTTDHLILWIKTDLITAVCITPRTLNNFSFHYFVSVHSCPVLFYNYYLKVKLLTAVMFFFSIVK